ncbi:MAG TPA: cysteine hydrolase [Caulobacteraceae bacterium]|nr:cysteine hydrolase [Caulobacteraceae bacterium]
MHTIRLPRWAVERGAVLNDFPALEAGRTALVNIDMQNAFLAEDVAYGNAHARDVVPRVNRLSRAMRTAGAKVIWTRQTYTAESPLAPADWQYDPARPGVAAGMAALVAGAPGHELYPEMDVAPSDIVVDKFRYGAFSCPAGALPETLERLGIAMIVITGTLTNCCCESTAREANMAGYKVMVVADATAAVTDAEHNAALLNLRLNFADVRRAKAVLGMIEALRA